jgi:YegS/Rv2252/BmrU family lipid kinase
MTTLFVKNPHCRDGDTDTSAIEKVLGRIDRVDTFVIGSDRSVAAHIDAMQPAPRRIVVAGGDGTLHSMLPEVIERKVPLGVIPLGTANDFARSLQLPEDPVAAAEAITDNCVRSVDLGVANGHYFLNATGIGLGPELTKRLDQDKKKRLGVFAYLESLMEVIGKRRNRYAIITVDGREIRTSFLQITVANGRYYGGGMSVSEDADINDGLLHILVVKPLRLGQLLLRALRMRNGTASDDDKFIFRSGEIVEVSTRKVCDVTADGELITQTPLIARSFGKALQVFVPHTEAILTRDRFVREYENVRRPAVAVCSEGWPQSQQAGDAGRVTDV